MSVHRGGYAPCHNAEEVIEAADYDSEADLENPTGSVFCAHGAGFNVPWNEVADYMHLESCLKSSEESLEEENLTEMAGRPGAGRNTGVGAVSSGLGRR